MSILIEVQSLSELKAKRLERNEKKRRANLKEHRFAKLFEHQQVKRCAPHSQDNLSSHDVYLNKHSSRNKRAELLWKSEEGLEFYEWMFSLFKKLGLYKDGDRGNRYKDDFKAGKFIGVSGQMIKLYRLKLGHFPSLRTFKALEELEKLCRISVKKN